MANSATRSQSNVSRATSQIARATCDGPPRAWNSGVAPTTRSSASRERCAWSSERATWARYLSPSRPTPTPAMTQRKTTASDVAPATSQRSEMASRS